MPSQVTAGERTVLSGMLRQSVPLTFMKHSIASTDLTQVERNFREGGWGVITFMPWDSIHEVLKSLVPL